MQAEIYKLNSNFYKSDKRADQANNEMEKLAKSMEKEKALTDKELLESIMLETTAVSSLARSKF